MIILHSPFSILHLNAAIADDPTKIASVQMELFPRTGEVALRYDLANVGNVTYTAGLVVDGTNHFVEVGAETREVVFQRVHPDDWDMDGLPNSLDLEPRNPTAVVDYNQNDTWAMLAFPSNAAEIAALGFAAWVRQHAADPNRRLVALRVASKKGAYPVCLNFGNIQVMCDGTEEILFPIDCGARYPFSVSGGELARVSVPGAAMRDTSWFDGCEPREFCVDDVTVCQESVSSGWLCRTADVEVDGLDGAHFFLDDSRTVTAVVTNCHADAYLDCTWTGGEGVTFSNRHSLDTVIAWQTTNSVAWATNHVTLVTNYEGGYAITNGYVISVGPQVEPSTTFTIDCPAVQFLNDGTYDGTNNYDRAERVYPIVVTLLAAHGTEGYLSVVAEGGTQTRIYHDRNRESTVSAIEEIPLEVPVSGGYTGSVTFYMTSSGLGRGTLRITFIPTGDGSSITAEAPFQVIEPICRLVTTEKIEGDARYVNPSRLVWGTNAVLKVSVNLADGDTFNPSNNVFSPVAGPGRIASQYRIGNAWYAIIEATAEEGTFKVEARFNSDDIQPQFVLPIVKWRVLDVRAFVVDPPIASDASSWDDTTIRSRIAIANEIFSQVGIKFELKSITHGVGNDDDWWIPAIHRGYALTSQVEHLIRGRSDGTCIAVYFTGRLGPTGALYGWGTRCGAFIARSSGERTVAHELGHVLGLWDIYSSMTVGRGTQRQTFWAEGNGSPVTHSLFKGVDTDWGRETGNGFYGRTDICGNVLRYLLMHGWEGRPINRGDIPDGMVHGLLRGRNEQFPPGDVKVGAKDIKPEDEEVYSICQ